MENKVDFLNKKGDGRMKKNKDENIVLYSKNISYNQDKEIIK